eukprot:5254776-Amphidinium_carterae.1
MAMKKCTWLDADINEAYFWHGSGKSADGTRDLIESMVSFGLEVSEEEDVLDVPLGPPERRCVGIIPPNASWRVKRQRTGAVSRRLSSYAQGPSARCAAPTSMYGIGVYLADLASKANLYVPCPVCYQGSRDRAPCTCTRDVVEGAGEPYRMLLCRGALGTVHVEKNSEREFLRKHYKGAFNPAVKLGVDSVMAVPGEGPLQFREYIVYSDSACYPEFIVHYWRKDGDD